MRHAGMLAAALLAVGAVSSSAHAQQIQNPFYPSYVLNQYYYYPYQAFPMTYWPQMGPRYPELPGMPYQRPPAYMAYPAFREPGWRYDLWEPHKYYRGFHFWLDQF